jgi:hypothetical protein
MLKGTKGEDKSLFNTMEYEHTLEKVRRSRSKHTTPGPWPRLPLHAHTLQKVPPSLPSRGDELPAECPPVETTPR